MQANKQEVDKLGLYSLIGTSWETWHLNLVPLGLEQPNARGVTVLDDISNVLSNKAGVESTAALCGF